MISHWPKRVNVCLVDASHHSVSPSNRWTGLNLRVCMCFCRKSLHSIQRSFIRLIGLASNTHRPSKKVCKIAARQKWIELKVAMAKRIWSFVCVIEHATYKQILALNCACVLKSCSTHMHIHIYQRNVYNIQMNACNNILANGRYFAVTIIARTNTDIYSLQTHTHTYTHIF